MEIKWSKSEKKIARSAFDLAYERECKDIMNDVKTSKLETPSDLWNLCDMLETRRNEVGHIYDYRYSQLIRVFSELIKKGYLDIEELDGLSTEKLEVIKRWVSINV